jgi:hypothetical protein
MYDIQSQIIPPKPCVGGANTPKYAVIDGVKSFVDLGIEPQDLIVGLPWLVFFVLICSVLYDVCFLKI